MLCLNPLYQRCTGTNTAFRCIISTDKCVLCSVLGASYLHCPMFTFRRTTCWKSDFMRAHRLDGPSVNPTKSHRPNCPTQPGFTVYLSDHSESYSFRIKRYSTVKKTLGEGLKLTQIVQYREGFVTSRFD